MTQICKCGHNKYQHSWRKDERCSHISPYRKNCPCKKFEPQKSIKEIIKEVKENHQLKKDIEESIKQK